MFSADFAEKFKKGEVRSDRAIDQIFLFYSRALFIYDTSLSYVRLFVNGPARSPSPKYEHYNINRNRN